MDTESLLKSLNAYKVQYVIIGAAALPVHGFSRVTVDIDIFVRATPRNVQRTLDALKNVGYDISDLTREEMLRKKILFRQYVQEVDIHPHVKGATFRGVWARKVQNRIGKADAYFAGLGDLIRMKKAAGRPKDLEDLRVLEKLKARMSKRIVRKKEK